MRSTLEPCGLALSDRRWRPNHQMVLDTANPSHVLRCNPKRPSLVLGSNGPVQMNHAVFNHDVIGEQMSLGLIPELGHELFPNGGVINALGRLRLQGGQALEQVASRNDAHELAVAQHRNALDPMPFNYSGNLRHSRGLLHADHACCHNVPGSPAMRFGVIPRQ
jgi:hypothetical protein